MKKDKGKTINSPRATATSPWDGKKSSIKQFLGRNSKQVYHMLYVEFYKIMKKLKLNILIVKLQCIHNTLYSWSL